MKQQEIFEHFSDQVKSLLDQGESPAEIAEILAAVSMDLAFQTAPSPEHAFMAVIAGLKAMTSVRISMNEDEEGDEDLTDNSEADEIDTSVPSEATFH